MRLTIILAALACLPSTILAGGPLSSAEWKKLHQQAVNRQRRIIFNNDGNEPVYYCNAATPAELLRSRTSPLAGSQVDSIFYCTWSSGFGLFTHNTRIGQVFDIREKMFQSNRTREFLDKGIDPLQVMLGFARQHGVECFWSMRLNDTHDGSGADYGPVMFRANRLKQEHPEWLIGSKEKPPRHGAWSAVDFGVGEIRELAFRYCEEVCEGYAIDGIELDFFRHAFFFKCSGRGEPCGQAELDQMTSLLQRIRAMTEKVGRKRGRPIALAVRAPDSVEYCKFIGLDLERWLADGLIDLLIVSGYTQLNRWEYSVQLGHRYGVRVYPSLDEPRIGDQEAQTLRQSLATYRGRALSAWSAGADGIYMFNFFDPHSQLLRELGDPAALRKLDRNYLASVRGPGHMPVPHGKFIRIPTMNPANPISIRPQETAHVEVYVGESLSDADVSTRVTLRLRFKSSPAPKEFRVIVNDRELTSGDVQKNWLEFVLPHTSLHQGINTVEVLCASPPAQSLALLDLCVEITGQ